MSRVITYPDPGSEWVHVKSGSVYRVFGVARHTETGVDLVIYSNNQGDLYARPVNMWEDMISQGPSKRFKPRFVPLVLKGP